jgi:choline kinase
MIGLIPASGKASRLGGLPKFALPCDKDNTPLLTRQVKQMSFYVDKIIVSTTNAWYELVKSFNLPKTEIVIIEPSTMNDALIKMAREFSSDKYLIGMADTYFEGENPYIKLSQSINDNGISAACWKIDGELKGRVGQVELVKNKIIDIQDKVSNCDYPHMWGALGLNKDTLFSLNKFSAHPGIDLEYILVDSFSDQYAFEVEGKYFDVGTLAGYRNLLNRLEL